MSKYPAWYVSRREYHDNGVCESDASTVRFTKNELTSIFLL